MENRGSKRLQAQRLGRAKKRATTRRTSRPSEEMRSRRRRSRQKAVWTAGGWKRRRYFFLEEAVFWDSKKNVFRVLIETTTAYKGFEVQKQLKHCFNGLGSLGLTYIWHAEICTDLLYTRRLTYYHIVLENRNVRMTRGCKEVHFEALGKYIKSLCKNSPSTTLQPGTWWNAW